MKFTVEYPSGGPGHDPALLTKAGVGVVARAADRIGFDALAFTEHPAPSLKWLRHGGHETLDLTSALAFCAAVTERIRLMTYLLVLPYHNPFTAAKALTTIDLFSDGRLTVIAGVGYLRSEFLALGVDFESRNERFDESLELMRALWTSGGGAVRHEGAHFTGLGVAHIPGPVQAGGPPVLIGGNAALARRRAARQQGWSPIIISEIAARTSRTAELTLDSLPTQVKEVREAAAAHHGPDAAFTVQVQGPYADVMRGGVSQREYAEVLARLDEAGVDAVVLQPRCTSVDDAVAGMEEFAAAYF